MKNLIKLLALVAMPVMFLTQCNTTVSSCIGYDLNDDGFYGTFVKCIEAPGLVEEDCDADATFYDGAACVTDYYTKKCDALLGFTFGSGTWHIEGAAVYYGGTSELLDATAGSDCLGYGGTVSSL
jgi:hypothetical protein